MIHIIETERDVEFTSPMYFDRSELVKRKLSELNRDELQDLTCHLLNGLEKIHGNAERAAELTKKIDDEVSEFLGWKEDLNEGR